LHLAQEVQDCQPELVIGLGERVYRVMHSSDDFQTPAPDPEPFGAISGVPMPAGDTSHAIDNRSALFSNLNVVHLYHPSALIRPGNAAIKTQHWDEDIQATQNFIDQISL
jgi:hypothetical protein